MTVDFTTRVVRNTEISARDFLVELEAPADVAHETTPGQFLMIGIPGADILLRRPFSVCGLPGTFREASRETIQVLYRVYGRGTTLMASLKPGASLLVLGPLGRGFELPDDTASRPIFVAGGIGSAPFPALAAALAAAGRKRPLMLYGGRSRGELPLLEWFEEHCDDVRVATDDGSLGRRGLVTDMLADVLDGEGASCHVYACGPNPMLRAVASDTTRRGLRCDLSIEAPMACGFGVCLGCVVPCRGDRPGEVRYDRVCVEGPVMRAERLAW